MKITKYWTKTGINKLITNIEKMISLLEEPNEESSESDKCLFIKQFNILQTLKICSKELNFIHTYLNYFGFISLNTKNIRTKGFNLDEINNISYIINLGIKNQLQPINLLGLENNEKLGSIIKRITQEATMRSMMMDLVY